MSGRGSPLGVEAKRPRAMAQSCACRRTMPGKSVPVVPIVNRQSTIDNRQWPVFACQRTPRPSVNAGCYLSIELPAVIASKKCLGREKTSRIQRGARRERRADPGRGRAIPDRRGLVLRSRRRSGKRRGTRDTPTPSGNPGRGGAISRPTCGRVVAPLRLTPAGVRNDHRLALPGFPPRPGIVRSNGPSTTGRKPPTAGQSPPPL